MKNALSSIAAETISRYSARFTALGYDVKALGWGSAEQQLYRFTQTITFPSLFAGRSVVDIGCGFGDYLDFLLARNVGISAYHGIDINPDLIGEARRRHASKAGVDFMVRNLHDGDVTAGPLADVGVMLGVLNFKLCGELDNLAYTELMLSRAFSVVRDVLIVDFLSAKLTPDYPKEEFVYYHDPADVLNKALSLTDSVLLMHDYAPIPQREFMLFMKKY